MQLDWGRAPHTARLLSTSASSAIGEQEAEAEEAEASSAIGEQEAEAEEAEASSAAAACIGHPCNARSGARKRPTRIAHPRIRPG